MELIDGSQCVICCIQVPKVHFGHRPNKPTSLSRSKSPQHATLPPHNISKIIPLMALSLLPPLSVLVPLAPLYLLLVHCPALSSLPCSTFFASLLNFSVFSLRALARVPPQ